MAFGLELVQFIIRVVQHYSAKQLPSDKMPCHTEKAIFELGFEPELDLRLAFSVTAIVAVVSN